MIAPNQHGLHAPVTGQRRSPITDIEDGTESRDRRGKERKETRERSGEERTKERRKAVKKERNREIKKERK